MAVWILYNPLAGGDCREIAEMLEVVVDDEVTLYDITRITNYAAFLSGLTAEDRLVIVARRLREDETRSELRTLIRMATKQ